MLFQNFRFVPKSLCCSKISGLFQNLCVVRKFYVCSKIFVLFQNFVMSQNFCFVLYIVYFVSFCIFFVCKCVLYYWHRVATQLQLTNVSYHIKPIDHSPLSYIFDKLCQHSDSIFSQHLWCIPRYIINSLTLLIPHPFDSFSHFTSKNIRTFLPSTYFVFRFDFYFFQQYVTIAQYCVFYIYYSVHRNILWNDQQMQQCAVRFIFLQVHSTCFGLYTRPSSGAQV